MASLVTQMCPNINSSNFEIICSRTVLSLGRVHEQRGSIFRSSPREFERVVGDSNNIDMGEDDGSSNERSELQCMPFMMTILCVPISNQTKFSLELKQYCKVE